MPRLTQRNPKYRRHRASGQAIVTLNGQDLYLGPYGSKASRDEYDRLTGEWLANGRTLRRDGAPPLTAAALILAYWHHVEETYRGPDGQPSDHAEKIRRALGFLRRLYGHTPAAGFGPLALRAVRQSMIEPRAATGPGGKPQASRPQRGLCRSTANAFTDLIRRMFRWGVEHEMVPASVFHGLQAVEGLRKGKTTARESTPVKPVAEEWVEAVRPLVSPQVRAMIDLQLLTGMRPGEVCQMRIGDLDTTGKLWIYKPATHKTAHLGHERVIYIGPQAQEVLAPYLKPDLQAFIFCPADSVEWWREQRHQARTTPLSCGNVPGSNRKRRLKREAGERYDVASYRRAIARACDDAIPPPPELARQKVPGNGRKAKGGTRWETPAEWKDRLGDEKWAELRRWQEEHRWHPHQLRHNAATGLRKQYGLEAARVVLGHRSAAVAEVYAEIDQAKAGQIMGEVG